jgi:protein-S-isoprenylcysteine O-methyltransferase Ste14
MPPPRASALAFAWTGAAIFAISLVWFLYCYLVRFEHVVATSAVRGPSIVADVWLFSMFALHHSVLARAGVKHRVRQLVAPELERSVYTWVSSLLFIIVCTWWRPVPGVVYQLDGVWRVTAYGVQLAGLILTARAAGAIDVLDLAGVRPLLERSHAGVGRHVALKMDGLYGLVRHPIYFAWTLFVFGTPTMTGTRALFALVSTAYLAIAVPWEERDLIETFGDEYERYRRKVRWRMIPGIY